MDWILLETVNIELLGLGSIPRSQICSKEEPTQDSSEELDNDFQIARKYRSRTRRINIQKKSTYMTFQIQMPKSQITVD